MLGFTCDIQIAETNLKEGALVWGLWLVHGGYGGSNCKRNNEE